MTYTTFQKGELEEASETIDAALFTGNVFLLPDNQKVLKYYLERWTKQLAIIEQSNLCDCDPYSTHHDPLCMVGK